MSVCLCHCQVWTAVSAQKEVVPFFLLNILAFQASFIPDLCLLGSLNTLCQCTKKSFASMASDMTPDIPGDQPLKCVYFAIRELTAVIALKVSVL